MGGRCWSIISYYGVLQAGDSHSGCPRRVLFTQLLHVGFFHAGTDSEINVFHRTANFVIDGDDKFDRRIRGNMLYLNDPTEAVRVALIDFGWWRSRGRIVWTSWSPHSSTTWPRETTLDYGLRQGGGRATHDGQGTKWNERLNLLRMIELNCLDCENIPPLMGGMNLPLSEPFIYPRKEFILWVVCFLNICLTKFDYACKSLSILQLSNLKYISNMYCMIHWQCHSSSLASAACWRHRSILPGRWLRWLQRARLLRCTNVTRSMSILLVTTCDSSEPWHRIRWPIEAHRPQLT